MPEFFFQIKGKAGPDAYSMGNWAWPPIWSDRIEADDYDSAKAKIDSMYGRKFPLRVLSKDLDSNEFLLSITPMDRAEGYTKRMFEVVTCKSCGKTFRTIEKYQVGSPGGGMNYCSNECQRSHNEIEYYRNREDGNGVHVPVIYRIHNKTTDKSYVGKTKQAFTFRWYQHFFQAKTDSKFYEEVQKSKITDWIFEVVEIIEMPDGIKIREEMDRHILERETFHMKRFDSVRNGYNTAYSISDANNKSISPELELK